MDIKKFKKLIFILLVKSLLVSASVFSETKFISGWTDGFSAYAIIERDGKQYRTDEYGPKVNNKLWEELSEEDRRKLLKVYWSPNLRIPHFGRDGNEKMANWINEAQGWTAVVENLKQKHANKEFPELKKFYDSALEIPYSNKCTDQKIIEEVQKSDLYKEAVQLRNLIQYDFETGKSIYQKMVNVKWQQVGVAVKGISAGLIPVIVDNFMTGFITNGASKVSELVANTYQFAQQIVDKAKNNKDISPAEIIKDLEKLIEMMEKDATTAKEIVEQNIEKLKNINNQIDALCEEISKKKKEKEEEYKENIKKTQSVGKVDIVITSYAEDEEKRTEEIRKKATAICEELAKEWNETMDEYRREVEEVYKKLEEVPEPKLPQGECRVLPLDLGSDCFSMNYSVSEIKSFLNDFPRAISEINSKIENLEEVKNMAERIIDTYVPRFKSIQERINGVIGDKKELWFYPLPCPPSSTTLTNIFGSLNNLIPSLEERKTKYEADLKLVETSYEIVKKGLEDRINWQKETIRSYDSLETNFINSYSQVIDAVYKLKKLHSSNEFFITKPGYVKPEIDFAKIKSLRNKLWAIKDDVKREKEIEKLVEKLKEIQKEENHQIMRLVIGQNNTDSDYEILMSFLENYTQGGIHCVPCFKKIKQDTLEVTGVNIKDPYYDIVKEMTNNDYTLWKTTGGWIITPESLRTNIDEAIAIISGRNEYYEKLSSILEKVNKNGRRWLDLSPEEFREEINIVNGEAYEIFIEGRNMGEVLENSPSYKIYNEIIAKTTSLSNEYYQKESLNRVKTELSSHLEGARNALSSKNINDYQQWIDILQSDIKPGSDADKLKSDAEVNRLITDAKNVIGEMKKEIEKEEKNLEQQANELIKEFYNRFKYAYETKNETLVISFLSDRWSSGDGTTLEDLQENLRNSFKVFNEIKYNISNLTIKKLSSEKYRVSYDLTIVGIIYKNNIKHEEKSTVEEEVIIDKSGKVKIFKTVSGKFWYME